MNRFATFFLVCMLGACATQAALVHPGIGLNATDLANLVKFVKGGVEPWRSYYAELTARDHRFSKHPHVRRRQEWTTVEIDGRDYDDRCQWDSQASFCQSLQYLITGEEIYRRNALDLVRWYAANTIGGRAHWDSQFRWPNAERYYLMACELLRYTGPKEGPLAWTEADTQAVNRFLEIGKDMWWGRRTYLNQLQFAVGGPLARSIWLDKPGMYAEMVEIVMVNSQGPVGEQNGSMKEICRLVTSNEVTGASVKAHVQYSEMGRDIGHAFPGFGAMSENLAIIRSQGTKVDPVRGTVSTAKTAVDPIEFLGARALRAVNEICKYNLGFDIDWTPIYINRAKNEVWSRPCNAGGGRGRIVDAMDVVYGHYRWVRQLNFDKSEASRYFGYANRLRGPNVFNALIWTPPEAATRWTDERIDPGEAGINRFADYILPADGSFACKTDKDGTRYISMATGKFILPLFLHFRKPLPRPGEYCLRYRTDGVSALATIDLEDYNTEFTDPETCLTRKLIERIKLPSTKGEWKDFTFTLQAPPDRNLVKLCFVTRGKALDLATLTTPAE